MSNIFSFWKKFLAAMMLLYQKHTKTQICPTPGWGPPCPLKPLITKPTRITESNATLIDHIWTNDIRHTSLNRSHIILTDITDHLPCVTVVKNSEFHLKGYKTITKRVINDKNRLKFTRRISEVKNILTFQVNNKSEPSLESKHNNFFDHISMIYNECFPLVTKSIHSKTLSKPWITPVIQSLIKKEE